MESIPDHPAIRNAERTGYSRSGVCAFCDLCGDPILTGETYYSIGDATYCYDCMESFAVIATDDEM